MPAADALGGRAPIERLDRKAVLKSSEFESAIDTKH